MPRQVRIEFPGALYHVMARGDRREPIVCDDEDRQTFVRTLERACERAGLWVHAWVLMNNHYHLLLETPRGNLSAGMGWLQNAFTRRINTRHRLWGHLFGGRYKAILVEAGNCFWALLDYIHLNPVRAGMVNEEQGLESFAWSSLPYYLVSPRNRPVWMRTQQGFEVTGCPDNPRGRREFLELLEKRVDWRVPTKAGILLRDGDAAPQLAPFTDLRRSWFFGSQEFKERLLRLGGARIGDASGRRANGYGGQEVSDHAEARARELIRHGLDYFGVTIETLRAAAKGDWRKGVIGGLIQSHTTMRLDWISKELGMGVRAACCRTIGHVRKMSVQNKAWKRAAEMIVKKS